MADNKELQVILQEQGVSKTSMAQLIEAFGAPFTEAGEILVSYQDIKVTSGEQTQDMAKAREQRLILKRIRTGVEATRKELKEDALRAGKAIDSVARYIKTAIEPAEQYLELQEKFVEIQIAKEAAELKATRLAKLAEYGADPAIYNLDTMTDESFATIVASLESIRKQEQAEAEAQAKAEEEARLAKEEEDKRVREENEKLKAEAEAREAAIKAEREEREAKEQAEAQARAAEEAKAEAERQAEYKRVSAIRVDILEYAHSIKTVQDATDKLNAVITYFNSLPSEDQRLDALDATFNKTKTEIVELKQFIIDREAKAEADAKAAAEAKAKAEAEEAERKALLSPDKDKLTKFSTELDVFLAERLPAVQSNQAQQIINKIEQYTTELQDVIQNGIEKL